MIRGTDQSRDRKGAGSNQSRGRKLADMQPVHLCLAGFGVAVLVVISGCQLPAHDQAKQQADGRWREVRSQVKLQLGRQQVDGGHFEEAVTTLSEAVALDPNCVETYALLAQANLELAKPASAEQFLRAARSRGFESAELCYLQGVVFEQRNESEKALMAFERARQLDPAGVDSLVAQAECLVGADRADEARTLLEANLDRFDDNATVATLAGHVAAKLGDREAAAKHLHRAFLHADDDPRIVESLALQLAELNQCEQAVPLLRKLLGDTQRESGVARRALAGCLLQKSEPHAVVELLADHAREHPDDEPVSILLAQAYLETGDLISAQRAIDRVRPRNRGTPSVVLLAAAVEWRRAEHAAAADRLYILLEADPTNTAAYLLLAQVLRDQHFPDEARQCDERAEQLRVTRSGP